MPVEDHPVHEVTRIGLDKPYGCCNSKRSNGYIAPDRKYFSNGQFSAIYTYIEDKMSKECRYDLSESDVRCSACHQRGQGSSYNSKIRSENG